MPTPLPTTALSQIDLLRDIAGLLEQIWRMQQKHDRSLQEVMRLHQLLLARAPPQRQLIGPALDDPVADHKALECAGFPSDQQHRFTTRWQARPVIRAASSSRSLITTRGADEDAPMWVLLAGNEADRYPVILGPAAYVPIMHGQSRWLVDAVGGVFDLASPSGRRPVMDRPALATPAGFEPDTFVIARAGLVRA